MKSCNAGTRCKSKNINTQAKSNATINRNINRQLIEKTKRYTGCLNMLCQTSNHLLGIKNTLLSHKNGICTFMRCGNLTYDTWIWLKITSLSSTASVLNDGRISLEIPSFCSEIYFFQNIKIR